MAVVKKKKKPIRIISRIVFAGLLLFIFYSISAPIKRTFINLPLFKIKEINIYTPVNIDKNKVGELSGIKKDMPIMDISIDKASDAIKTIPWVKTVSIKRRFPNKLDINVESKEVLAIGKQKNKLYYIDQYGQIIDSINTGINNQYIIASEYNNGFAKAVEIIEAINSITTPGVYIKKETISELIIEGDDLFTIILSGIPTKLHFRLNNLEKRLINVQKVLADLELHGEKATAIDAALENNKVVAKNVVKIKSGK